MDHLGATGEAEDGFDFAAVAASQPGCVSCVVSDQAASDRLYAGAHPIEAADIAETLWWLAGLPPHLNVNRMEIMPVSQSFAGFQIHRD